MSGAARLHWPHKVQIENEEAAPPRFESSGGAWAEWIAIMHADAQDAAFDALNDLGLGALLVALSTAAGDADPADDDVQWATPDRLLAAAQSAHELLITKDARFAPLFALYCKAAGSAPAEPQRQQMAQDLLDVAAMAQWALAHGKAYVAMDLDL
jgi:hypothetical protein